MSLYEKFSIPSYWGKSIAIKTHSGLTYQGVMYDLVSDEDEPEVIAIEIGEMLEAIYLDDVESIEIARSLG